MFVLGLKYNSRQLFWISSALQFCSSYPLPYLKNKYSDSRNYIHSPNEFRVIYMHRAKVLYVREKYYYLLQVNGPLQNLVEFSYDFGCPLKSFMNPEKKCAIW